MPPADQPAVSERCSLSAVPPVPPGTHAISVEGLTHAYPQARPGWLYRHRGNASGPTPQPAAPTPRRSALDDVTFRIEPGEIFGILGPNGGGKTTLFRILCTLLQPTCGSVRVFGLDVLAHPRQVRELLGVVFQMPSLDVKLTADENLTHQGHLYGLSGADLARRVQQQLQAFGLDQRQHEPVERFSGGMRRRVELAKALMHEPKLLLLDEPSTGLDPGARRDLWASLERLRHNLGVTVALTTHLMEEADRCDRLAILSEGRLVAIDTPARLKSRIGGDVITIDPCGDDPAAEDLRRQIEQRFGPWSAGTTPIILDGKIRLEKHDGAAFVAALASAFPGRLDSITVGRPTLEDVFTQLTGHKLWDEATSP